MRGEIKEMYGLIRIERSKWKLVQKVRIFGQYGMERVKDYSKTYEIRTCKIRNFKEPDSLKKFRIVEKYPNYYIFGLNLNNRSIFGDTEA